MWCLGRSNKEQTQRSRDAGFGIVEILVSIGLVAIMALAVTGNLIVALRISKITEANHAASSLAVSKMEEFAAIDPESFDASDSEIESGVTWSDWQLLFTRTTTVTVNGDSSRSVEVTVESESQAAPTFVTFQTTFVVWE